MLERLCDLRKAVEREGGAAEIYALKYEQCGIELTDGKTKKANRKQETGYSLRVIHKGRVGFSACAGAEPAPDLVERALASAQLGAEARFEFPPPQKPQKDVVTYDARTPKLTFQQAREVGEQLCATLKERYPEALVEAGVSWVWAEKHLANSSGAECSQRFSSYSVSAMVQQVKGEEITMVLCGKQGFGPQDEFASRVAEVVLERLDAAKREAKITSGPKKVIFDPMYGVFSILTPLWEGLNGENVARKASPLTGRVGEKIFSDLLTIVDDPLSDGVGAYMWDGEGVAARRNVLVEGGVLCNFVFDLENAARAGMEPTGSARRGLLSRPKPSFSNFIIEAGTTPLSDMIASIDEGLYVVNPLAAWGANPLSGQFSTPLGFALKIERGEIVGRVRQVSIAGNIYEDLKKVTAVSREVEWFGNRLIPHILVDGINVVAK